MKLKEFESLIAKREGKKSQVSIGNIREIVRIIKALLKEYPIQVMRLLIGGK